ncbi:MAG: SRPBCC domain-containing protein [Kofleriaceae bacterium]
MSKKQITMERTFDAALADVWELWTTKAGIESWWGPEGFRVEVRSIDLRPGGTLVYLMIAEAPEMVAFMKSAGMPTATENTIRYREVVPQKRLVYAHSTDFIKDVEPYDVTHTVELFPRGDSVRMVLTFDAMHAEEWTQRAAAGWEQELGKLGKALASRRT